MHVGFPFFLTFGDRRIRDIITAFQDEPSIMHFTSIFRDALWHGGKLRPSQIPRSTEDKARTRDEANRKLSALVPGNYLALRH